jgi:tetraprenyl-beta-curcumene synthase
MHPTGPIRLMYRLYRYIFPTVKSELQSWRKRAEQIPDPELRAQALSSIENKSFHCEGGCVYAAASMPHRDSLIRLIVAYQTISDYLDNLCDRSTSLYAENFERLHQSMLDAVSLTPPQLDYYAFNQEKNDGGYLQDLVRTVQEELLKLPHYASIKKAVFQLASLYCQLQIHKHVDPSLREQRLLNWWENNKPSVPSTLKWNEFAAATGSTIGIFHLFQVASLTDTDAERIQHIANSYFPWICSLHILLDYLIDLEEDELGGDLNFIAYYSGQEETLSRLKFIVDRAKEGTSLLPDQKFHNMIIDGLLGLYLSDGKVGRQPMVKQVAGKLIRSSSLYARFFFLNSRGYRGSKAVLQAPRTAHK